MSGPGELEAALAQAHLKNLALEALLECVEAHYQVDVKRTFGPKGSPTSSGKSSVEASSLL